MSASLPPLFYASYVALWILLVFLSLLVLLLYRHFGLVVLGSLEGVQRDGLPVGETAPVINGSTPDGTRTSWAPGHGEASLVLFAAPDCEPCEQVMPSVISLAGVQARSNPSILAVVGGPPELAARLVDKFGPPFRCIADDGSGNFDHYRVRVTPFAFVVGADGRIYAKGLCDDALRLRDLLFTGGLDEAAVALEVSERPQARDEHAVVEAEVGS